eukprot:scaffold21769_cov41-Phaeocystis_antarctica.AAC.2
MLRRSPTTADNSDSNALDTFSVPLKMIGWCPAKLSSKRSTVAGMSQCDARQHEGQRSHGARQRVSQRASRQYSEHGGSLITAPQGHTRAVRTSARQRRASKMAAKAPPPGTARVQPRTAPWCAPACKPAQLATSEQGDGRGAAA